MKELSLVYLSRLKSTFEVYDNATKELVGHIVVKTKDGNVTGYCFTPVRERIGSMHPSIAAALCSYYNTQVRLNFAPVIE